MRLRLQSVKNLILNTKDSLKEDGQWDPILVRPKGDKYELIAGHNRVQAAKELGWTEIEANVKDLNDVDAMFLSLKTNLLRQEMSPIEQGKVLKQITDTFNITGTDLAKRLGKSPHWVTDKIKLALKLEPCVEEALREKKNTSDVAFIIASLEPGSHCTFLLYILKNNIKNPEDVRLAKRRKILQMAY